MLLRERALTGATSTGQASAGQAHAYARHLRYHDWARYSMRTGGVLLAGGRSIAGESLSRIPRTRVAEEPRDRRHRACPSRREGQQRAASEVEIPHVLSALSMERTGNSGGERPYQGPSRRRLRAFARVLVRSGAGQVTRACNWTAATPFTASAQQTSPCRLWTREFYRNDSRALSQFLVCW